VQFAANVSGGGGGAGGRGNGGNANAGGPNPAVAAAANNPAVANLWENLVQAGLNELLDHSIAKGLAVKYKDAPWEEAVAPSNMDYTDPARVMREIAQASTAKCFLAVNAARQVQLIYGMRFCHAIDGQGKRVLVLGGERLLIAGIERPPDSLTLAGNVTNQAAHFGEVTTRPPTIADALAVFAGDANLNLVDLLAAEGNDKDEDDDDAAVTLEVVARRTLVIHPKLGLLFVQPKSPK